MSDRPKYPLVFWRAPSLRAVQHGDGSISVEALGRDAMGEETWCDALPNATLLLRVIAELLPPVPDREPF